MLSSRSALTEGCWDAQQRLAAASCLGMEKSSKAQNAGPLERCSFPLGPTSLSICYFSAANPAQLSPLPRLRQHHPFSPKCKHESAWGTLCSPENFTHHRMKPLHHPSLLITTREASLGSSGQHRAMTCVWEGLTWVRKRHFGGEMTYWKVQMGTRAIFFTIGSVTASISKASDFISHLRCRSSSKDTIWQWLKKTIYYYY